MKKHPDCVAFQCGEIDCGKPGPCYINVREFAKDYAASLREDTRRGERERRYYDALTWALGSNGNFAASKPALDAGSYWWRTELAKRAGLKWNGAEYVDATPSPDSGQREPCDHSQYEPTYDGRCRVCGADYPDPADEIALQAQEAHSPDSGQREPRWKPTVKLCPRKGCCLAAGHMGECAIEEGGDPPVSTDRDPVSRDDDTATAPRSPDVMEGGERKHPECVAAMCGTHPCGFDRDGLPCYIQLARQPVTDAKQVETAGTGAGETYSGSQDIDDAANVRWVETAGNERQLRDAIHDIVYVAIEHATGGDAAEAQSEIDGAVEVIMRLLARLSSTEDGERERLRERT